MKKTIALFLLLFSTQYLLGQEDRGSKVYLGEVVSVKGLTGKVYVTGSGIPIYRGDTLYCKVYGREYILKVASQSGSIYICSVRNGKASDISKGTPIYKYQQELLEAFQNKTGYETKINELARQDETVQKNKVKRTVKRKKKKITRDLAKLTHIYVSAGYASNDVFRGADFFGKEAPVCFASLRYNFNYKVYLTIKAQQAVSSFSDDELKEFNSLIGSFYLRQRLGFLSVYLRGDYNYLYNSAKEEYSGNTFDESFFTGEAGLSLYINHYFSPRFYYGRDYFPDDHDGEREKASDYYWGGSIRIFSEYFSSMGLSTSLYASGEYWNRKSFDVVSTETDESMKGFSLVKGSLYISKYLSALSLHGGIHYGKVPGKDFSDEYGSSRFWFDVSASYRY